LHRKRCFLFGRDRRVTHMPLPAPRFAPATPACVSPPFFFAANEPQAKRFFCFKKSSTGPSWTYPQTTPAAASSTPCCSAPPRPSYRYRFPLLNTSGCRYRLHVTETVASGLVETVRPYLIDLETTNGISPVFSRARQIRRSPLNPGLQARTSSPAPPGSASTSLATTK
jgi:hypothetical protein